MADFPDNVFNGSIEDLNSIVNSTIADIPLKQGEITKEELQKALSTYPVLVKTPLPKPSEMVVENRQLCLTLKENATNKFDLFMCGGKGTDDTYLWYPVAKDDELGNYVPTTRKIANIDLSNDIDADELRKSLEAQRVIIGSTVPPESEKEDYAEIGDFYFRKLSLSPSLYLCVSKGINTESTDGEYDAFNYRWIDLSGYVPTSRKIATIDLVDDITIDELQEVLKTKPHTVGYLAPTKNTEGEIGELYFSINTYKMYAMVDSVYEEEGMVYNWVPLSNPEIVEVISEECTDEQVPSAKAVKTYVDDLFNSIINGNEVAY